MVDKLLQFLPKKEQLKQSLQNNTSRSVSPMNIEHNMKQTLDQFGRKVEVKGQQPQTEEEKAAIQLKKTIKRLRKKWPEKARLAKIGELEELQITPNNKKRFAIKFNYFDEKEKRVKAKTVRFGKHGVEYFIDHKDPIRRDNDNRRMRKCGNPFEANFWTMLLLQECEDPQEARRKFMIKYNLI